LLVPVVAVDEVSKTLGLPELAGPRLQRYIKVAIEKIGGFQTESGGFGLWGGPPPGAGLHGFAVGGAGPGRPAAGGRGRRRAEGARGAGQPRLRAARARDVRQARPRVRHQAARE